MFILFDEALNYEKNKTTLIRRLNQEYALGVSKLNEIANHADTTSVTSTCKAVMRGLLKYLKERRYEQLQRGDTQAVHSIDKARLRAMNTFFDI